MQLEPHNPRRALSPPDEASSYYTIAGLSKHNNRKGSTHSAN